RLGHAGVHQRVAELAEALGEELVRLADDLAEEAALVRVGHQLFDDDALDHQARSWKPLMAWTTVLASASVSSGYIGRDRICWAAASVSERSSAGRRSS